ncbi:hypothetical protein [Microcystis sp. LE19-84.1B]|jgi:hypothetical protein|uniref:hypothetical protein n=1 Tax=Microcystis sp. LE19-84.1B TaxID=3016438 RepID=UPI00068EDA2E|nr:hypothetical protein [Microcystis sp. LE19-84.1B]
MNNIKSVEYRLHIKTGKRQEAKGKRQKAKGRINNQFLINGFSMRAFFKKYCLLKDSYRY